MKEEIQIEQGARLADTKAPEKISTERARKFVSSKLAEKSRSKQKSFIKGFFNRRPSLAWGGSAFAFAVAVVIAVFLLPGRRTLHLYRAVEMESVHASSEQIDTAIVSTADSLGSIELPSSE